MENIRTDNRFCQTIIISVKPDDDRLKKMAEDPFFHERWEWSRGETYTTEPANDSDGNRFMAVWHEHWEEARTMSERTFRFSRRPEEEVFTSFRAKFGEYGSNFLFTEFLRGVLEKYGFSEHDPSVTLYWVEGD